MPVNSDRSLCLLSGTRLGPAAVNLISRPGDPGGLFRCQKIDKLGNLFRIAGPADRVSISRVFNELLVIAFRHTAAFMKIRDHDPGIYGVNANPLRGQFQRRTRVSWSTPAFETQYANTFGNARVPVTLDTLTMFPRVLADAG